MRSGVTGTKRKPISYLKPKKKSTLGEIEKGRFYSVCCAHSDQSECCPNAIAAISGGDTVAVSGLSMRSLTEKSNDVYRLLKGVLDFHGTALSRNDLESA